MPNLAGFNPLRLVQRFKYDPKIDVCQGYIAGKTCYKSLKAVFYPEENGLYKTVGNDEHTVGNLIAKFQRPTDLKSLI
jgi:hypothetical protein